MRERPARASGCAQSPLIIARRSVERVTEESCATEERMSSPPITAPADGTSRPHLRRLGRVPVDAGAAPAGRRLERPKAKDSGAIAEGSIASSSQRDGKHKVYRARRLPTDIVESGAKAGRLCQCTA
jgi:hypothetical protein